MSPKWIVGLVLLFVWMTLCGLVVSGESMPPDVQDSFNIISNFGIVSQTTSIGALDYIKAPVTYFTALFEVLTYSPPMFNTGYFELIRWLFIAPILAGAAFGLIILCLSIFAGTG